MIETTYGVYYAFGNHDKGYYDPQYRGYSGEDLILELERNQVKVLQDDIVLLGDDFYLIGRQDRSEDQRGNPRASMQELISGLEPDKYSIVLDHQPYDYAEQEAVISSFVVSSSTKSPVTTTISGFSACIAFMCSKNPSPSKVEPI